jgi:gliding motility-associated-like protein
METDSIIEIQPLNSFTYQVIAEDICGNVGQNSTTVVVEYVYANFDFDYEGNWGIETYNGSSPQNASFYWDFGDGTNSTEFDPSHEYNQLYSYDISLTATTLNGCVDSISRTFYPFMDIYIPNSFTPNNDGINDYFKAEGSDIREFELWIYNRWGEQVFNSTDIDVPWLGNHKGGEYYGQNEVYTYRVKAVGIRGNSIEKTGTVTLLR